MPGTAPVLTYVGGPTLLIEWGGIRLLTDPTLDPAPATYTSPTTILEKVQGPALGRDALLPLDAVLLSHDHHFDNLDWLGRELLAEAGRVITTQAGAARLGENAFGLAPWQSHVLAYGGRTASTEYLVASSEYYVLVTRYSVLATRYSLLATRH